MDELNILRQILNKLNSIDQNVSELQQGQAVMQKDISIMQKDISTMQESIAKIEHQQAIDSDSIDSIAAEVGKLGLSHKDHGLEINKLKSAVV